MIAFLLYVLTVVASNFALAHFGVISVGFGFMAPAAALFAGLTFTLRDFVQESRLGKRGALVAILTGAAISAIFAPAFALASVAAYAVSELADLTVFTALRKRGLFRSVIASNAVGLTLDSVIFLTLAFGSLAFLPGQLIAKGAMTALAVVIMLARKAVQPSAA